MPVQSSEEGKANSPSEASSAGQSTQTHDEGHLTRDGLAALLAESSQAATPEDSTPPPAAPASEPEPAEGETTTADDVPPPGDDAGDVPSQTESESDEAEAEADAEAAVEPEPAPKGSSPGVERRLAKLRAQLGDAQRKLEEYEARLSAQPEPEPAPAPLPALSPEILEVEPKLGEIVQRRNMLEAALQWCKANPEGGVIQTRQGPREFTAEEVERDREVYGQELADLRARFEVRMANAEEKVTARRVQTAQRVQAEYPWTAKPDSPQGAEFRAFLARYPGLKQLSDGELIAARYVAGLMAEKAKSAAPATRPKTTAPSPPRTTAAPARVAPKAAALKSALERHEKEHSRDSLANLLAAQEAVQAGD